MKHFLIEVFSDHQEQKWEKTSSVNKSVIRRVNTQWFGRKLVSVQPSNADQSGAFSLPYTVIGRRFGTRGGSINSRGGSITSRGGSITIVCHQLREGDADHGC